MLSGVPPRSPASTLPFFKKKKKIKFQLCVLDMGAENQGDQFTGPVSHSGPPPGWGVGGSHGFSLPLGPATSILLQHPILLSVGVQCLVAQGKMPSTFLMVFSLVFIHTFVSLIVLSL